MEKVCVLLSTYNGEKYLDEQIRSLISQKNVDMTILVRDDGSTDGTQSMLYSWAEKDSRIKFLEQDFGCNFRVAKSFTYLLNQADKMFPDIRYFSFCDQDDEWLDMKCCRAVKHLAKYNEKPALYYLRKKLIDGNLNPLDREDVIRIVFMDLKTPYIKYMEKNIIKVMGRSELCREEICV
ncbi:MAG: glycosyltransferase [Ruminococcus sp.]|nr:glycosyltransferase [Ruminococcus sp.]